MFVFVLYSFILPIGRYGNEFFDTFDEVLEKFFEDAHDAQRRGHNAVSHKGTYTINSGTQSEHPDEMLEKITLGSLEVDVICIAVAGPVNKYLNSASFPNKRSWGTLQGAALAEKFHVRKFQVFYYEHFSSVFLLLKSLYCEAHVLILTKNVSMHSILQLAF